MSAVDDALPLDAMVLKTRGFPFLSGMGGLVTGLQCQQQLRFGRMQVLGVVWCSVVMAVC